VQVQAVISLPSNLNVPSRNPPKRPTLTHLLAT
jgi:hypothetical protein